MRAAIALGAVALLVSRSLCAQADSIHPGPADKPVGVSNPRQMACLDSLLAPSIALGKRTFPAAKARFMAGLPRSQRFLVSVMIWDTLGHREMVFIKVNRVGADTLYGHLNSDLTVVKGYDSNADFRILESAVLDWTIARPDGTEEGNAVGKFLDDLNGRSPC